MIYVPVAKNDGGPPGCSQDRYKRGCVIDGHRYDIRWWKPDCFFYHPFSLISAYYGLNYPNFRERFGIPKEVFLLGDSGGFQNVTKKADLFPLKVLRWQERNVDLGFILDVPPYDFTGTAQFGGSAAERFDESLKQTRENAEIMADNRETKMPLYGVIQGETFKQMTTWYEALKDLNFDGYSLSPKPSFDPFAVAMHMYVAHINGIENLHVLQVTGINGLAMIAYAAGHMKFNHIYYDSATYAMKAVKRKYTLNLLKEVRISKLKSKTLPCMCPVCSRVNIDYFQNSEWPVLLISLHNIWQGIHLNNLLNSLKDDLPFLKNFIGRHCNDKTIAATAFFDILMDQGPESAMRKFGQSIAKGESAVKVKGVFDL